MRSSYARLAAAVAVLACAFVAVDRLLGPPRAPAPTWPPSGRAAATGSPRTPASEPRGGEVPGPSALPVSGDPAAPPLSPTSLAPGEPEPPPGDPFQGLDRATVQGPISNWGCADSGFDVWIRGVPWARTTSDAAGRFAIPDVPVGVRVIEAARDDGARGSLVVRIVAPVTSTTVHVAMGDGTIRGRVTLDGETVPDTLVSLWPGEDVQVSVHGHVQRSYRLYETLTDPDGRFLFEALQPGTYGLAASTEDGLRCDTVGVRVEPDATPEVELRLEPGAVIAGRVIGTGGRPVEGAGIRVSPQGVRVDFDTRTDADGRFRIEGNDRGQDHCLTIYDSTGRHRYREVTGIRPPASDLEIVLDEACVYAEVVDSAGAPIPNAALKVLTGEGSPRVRGTDALGRGVVGPLQDGTYRIRARAHGYQEATAEVEVRTGSPASVRFVLRQDIVIRGSVIGPDGGPAPDVYVVIVSASARVHTDILAAVPGALQADAEGNPWVGTIELLDEKDMAFVLTDVQGRFAISPHYPGGWRVMAFTPDLAPAETTVDATGPDVPEVRLALRLGRRHRGNRRRRGGPGRGRGVRAGRASGRQRTVWNGHLPKDARRAGRQLQGGWPAAGNLPCHLPAKSGPLPGRRRS